MTVYSLAADETTAELAVRRDPATLWRRWYVATAMAGDILAAVLVTLVVATAPLPVSRVGAVLSAGALVVLWPALLALSGAYSARVLAVPREETRRTLLAALLLVAAAAAASYVVGRLVGRNVLLVAAPGLPLLGCTTRAAARALLQRQRESGRLLPRLLLVGSESDVRELASRVQRSRRQQCHVAGGLVLTGKPSTMLLANEVPLLSSTVGVRQAVDLLGADVVLVAGGCLAPRDLRRLLWSLEDSAAELAVAPGVSDVDPHRISVTVTDGLPLLHVAKPRFAGLARRVKGLADRAAAAVLLLAVAPLLGVVALAVRRTSAGPVIFRQARVGERGEVFTVYKFRTMYTDAEVRLPELRTSNEADGPLFKVRADPRITPLGRILRRYSIDELPQLVNVVRGQMSLVGPRPPLPCEVAEYAADVRRRLLVKPGMTGLWQVSGRSDLSWEETVDLDLRYVDNWSLGADAAILGRTVRAVVGGRGAY